MHLCERCPSRLWSLTSRQPPKAVAVLEQPRKSAGHQHAHSGHQHGHSREGAKQPEVFNPARAELRDDPQRLEYLPPDKIVALLDAPGEGVVIDFGTGPERFQSNWSGAGVI